jgi:diguanylate cyclase (GGDEF)-like protein/PAS domain S-box-containing protein
LLVVAAIVASYRRAHKRFQDVAGLRCQKRINPVGGDADHSKVERLTPTREELSALVGEDEVYVLDAHALLRPVPSWLLEYGATEANQPISQRLELVHPEDRSRPAEMFLTALASPGQIVDGTYRMQADGRWHTRVSRMLNLLDQDVLPGVLVMGRNEGELEGVELDQVQSNVRGDFHPDNWLVEVLDERARIMEIDGMVEEILGRSAADLLGESATQLVAPESMVSAAEMWATLMGRPGATTAARQLVVRPDGSTLWIDSFLVSRAQPDGSIHVLNFMRDITEQRQQELAIEQLAEEFRSLAEEVPAVIFRCDQRGTISFHNELWATAFPNDLPATSLHKLVFPADHGALDAALARLATAEPAAAPSDRIELRGRRGDTMLALTLRAVGPARTNHVSFVGSVDDITSTMTLRRRASHDALTGLLNRDALEDHLAATMQEDRDGVIVAFLDLDGFKEVNDSFGHESGDLVLATIGQRLRRAFRASDVIGRYGGDEFVLVCKAHKAVDEAAIVQRAEQIFQDPIAWEAGHWQPAGSIGTARPEPDDDVRRIIRRADQAMYLVKARHRHRVAG